MNIQEMIPEGFAEKYPLQDDTVLAGRPFLASVSLLESKNMDKILEENALSRNEERQKRLQEDRAVIDSLTAPEEAVRQMRKIDYASRFALARKAFEIGGPIYSLIIDKLRTSGMDLFIENASLILTRAPEEEMARLEKDFLTFRNRYAQAAAALVLAYRSRGEALPDMIRTYVSWREGWEPVDPVVSNTLLFAIYMLIESLYVAEPAGTPKES